MNDFTTQVDDIIAECVPGGHTCDPQAVADALRPRIAAILAREAAMREALVWALGAGDDFRPRGTMDGPYWWRSELAERAGLAWDGERYVDAPAPSQPGEAPAPHPDPCPQCQPGGVCKTPSCGRIRSSELMSAYGGFPPKPADREAPASREAREAGRREGIEESAKAADDFLTKGRSPLGREVAAAIRALPRQ